MSSPESVHPVDEVLPAAKLAALGLQHVLVMYAGAIAVPLIISGALKLSKDQTALLIAADLFCCGLVTMIQSIGIGKVGIRLPIMMGVTFTAIAPIIATGSTPGLGMQAVFGAVLVAGLFTWIVAPYVSRLVCWFPPVVTGTVVLIIGISLMRVGINWAAGGNPTLPSANGPVPNPAYGIPANLAISGLVLLIIIGMIAYARGFLANLCVLTGIGTGFLIALALGKVHFDGISDAAWFYPILPFQFGLPRFDFVSCITLCVVMMVIMVEGVGQFLAIGEVVGRPTSRDDITRGLRADGLGAVLGGIFNTFTYTSYAQNIGLVQVTGVRSRWVCATAGGMLVILGCLPKLAYFAASIPQFVLGGAAIVMFGMVAATGIKILIHVDFEKNHKNLYIVAVSIALGMIPIVADKFFNQLPELLAKFCQNGILLGTVAAILLNMLFNGSGKERAVAFAIAKEATSVTP